MWMNLSDHFGETYNIFRRTISKSIPPTTIFSTSEMMITDSPNRGYPPLSRDLEKKLKAQSIPPMLKAL